MLLNKNDMPSLSQADVHQEACLYLPFPLFLRWRIRRENSIEMDWNLKGHQLHFRLNILLTQINHFINVRSKIRQEMTNPRTWRTCVNIGIASRDMWYIRWHALPC